MRILIISAVFYPYVKGGAEISATNLAAWLSRQGHEVGVLAAAQAPAEAVEDKSERGLRVWRIWSQRPYPGTKAGDAPGYLKPVWHGLDLFAPSNRKAIGRVLDAFKPEVVNVQYIQGLGYNGLLEIGKRGLPTVFTLHDLGLACLRMALFKGDAECGTQCTACRVTTQLKASYVAAIERFGFISPSAAVLSAIRQFEDFDRYPGAVIRNANKPAPPSAARTEVVTPRFLFVGRLHPAKGIHLLLEALAPLAERFAFSLKVLGSGPSEQELRERYVGMSWVEFGGQVAQQDVANAMVNSDLLFVPSIWAENSPGVIIEALALGLPVMGSNKAGIPELVNDGETGVLVEPGKVDAWRAAVAALLENPTELQRLRAGASARGSEDLFDEDKFGAQTLAFFETVAASTR